MYVNCRYFTMRRWREETQDEAGCSKKRRVEHATFLKWKRDLDREHQTFIVVEMRLRGGKWEECSFKAKVCTQFEEKIKAGRILVPSGSRELTWLELLMSVTTPITINTCTRCRSLRSSALCPLT